MRQAPILASHASCSTSPLSKNQAGCVGCVNLSKGRGRQWNWEEEGICKWPPCFGIGERMEIEWMEGNRKNSSLVGIGEWGAG